MENRGGGNLASYAETVNHGLRFREGEGAGDIWCHAEGVSGVWVVEMDGVEAEGNLCEEWNSS